MNLIIAGVFLLALSIVVLSFIDLKLSVAVYFAYMILVPYLEFKVAGFPLSYNLVNTLIFAVFLYHALIRKRFKIDFRFIAPFLFLYISLFYLSLFATQMPWSLQFTSWRISFMQTCMVSFVMWNLALADEKTIVYIKWAFLIAITVAGIYGIYLMKMEGINPYINYLSEYFGKKDHSVRFSELESRLDFSSASKIQATMSHPMTWTLILNFSMILVLTLYLKTGNKLFWILIVLVGFNILISGVRTGIAALVLGFLYFLIRYRNIKIIILVFLMVVAFGVIVQSNESLSNLFASFTDVSGNKSDVSGSSISMRLKQLQGTINEIKGFEFAGKGYGWTGYYLSMKGIHPVILAFESLIFMILCNSGIIGLLVWITFFILLFILNRRILTIKTDIYLLDTFIIVYAAYATGTGEYGYMAFFAFFYSFLLVYVSNETSSIKQIKQIDFKNKGYIEFELANK